MIFNVRKCCCCQSPTWSYRPLSESCGLSGRSQGSNVTGALYSHQCYTNVFWYLSQCTNLTTSYIANCFFLSYEGYLLWLCWHGVITHEAVNLAEIHYVCTIKAVLSCLWWTIIVNSTPFRLLSRYAAIAFP